MNTLESEVERHFVWRVAMCGGMTCKMKAIGKPGFPDRIAFLPDGSMWLVELKRPKGGKLSERQKLFASDMKKLKQKYVCLWSKEQVDAWAPIGFVL